MVLLGSLYFSQGLPFGFFTQALPPMLRKQGFSLGQIGLTALLALPWALKFLWAPAVDRYPRRPAGAVARRRAWIVPLQLATVLTLAALAAAPALANAALMMAVLLLNLMAATQDIATDGLAVDLLAPSERGLANGLQVAGYRVGMIAGGGILLVLHDRLGSARTFASMALLTAVATLPIARLRAEPRPLPRAPGAIALRPVVHFLRRPGAERVLLLIVVYKAGDTFATGMLRPFLTDAGLTLAEIGWLIGTVGFVAGLVGALAGGLLVNRLGRRTALVGFGLLQAAAVAAYATLAVAGRPGAAHLYGVCAAEHFAGGMATAALFTCMMDWCSSDASATDYTVQASAVVVATGLASALAGFSAQAFGYFAHFCLAAALAVGALAVVLVCFPDAVQTAQVRGAREVARACA
jgi:predicted MFS family arabinose efflux permease